MKRNPFSIALFAVCLCTSIPVHAEVSTEKVIEVLELSGHTTRILGYPAELNKTMTTSRPGGKELPEALAAHFAGATKEAVVPSEILLEIALPVSREMTEAELQVLIDWFRSDLGKRISAAEFESSKSKTMEMVRDNLDTLLNNSRRADFAGHIERLSNLTRSELRIREETLAAVLAVTDAFRDPGSRVTLEAFRPAAKREVAKSQRNLEKSMIGKLVHTYRDIGERDLIKYEMFLGSNEMQKYVKLTTKGHASGLTNSMEKWIVAVTDRISSN